MRLDTQVIAILKVLKRAAKLLSLSTRTIDNLKRDGRMPQPIRIGKAVRWNRAELDDWVYP
jgi:excisionase family DNA binding protein